MASRKGRSGIANIFSRPKIKLRKFVSKRAKEEKRAPFYYFKGTRKEFGRLPLSEITNALAECGIAFPDRKSALAVAREFKYKVKQMTKRKGQPKDFAWWKGPFFKIETPKGQIVFKVEKRENGRIYVRQHPGTHSVGRLDVRSFDVLLKILKEGFRHEQTAANIVLFDERHRAIGGPWFASQKPAITKGDIFSIEVLAPFRNVSIGLSAHLEKAEPGEILRVNVLLSFNATEDEIAKKKAYYKKRLKGVPVSFTKADKEHKREPFKLAEPII